MDIWTLGIIKEIEWSTHIPAITALSVGAAAVAVPLLLFRSKPKHPLPPGPKGLPVIGNLLDIPVKEPWKVYNEWSKEHGDIIHLNALGTRIIILNSLESVNALLVRRATNFSDRAFSPVIGLTGTDRWALSALAYGQLWRDHRRIFHRFFNSSEVHKYHPIIEEEILRFMQKLHKEPKEFATVTRYSLGAIIMRIAYGVRDPVYNKSLVDQVEIFVRDFVEYSAPGRLLVNTFPSLRAVPSWFPGAGWKKQIIDLTALGENVLKRPWADSKERARKGWQTEEGSMAPQFVQQLSSASPYEEEVARGACAMAYIGGADTTVSSATALFLALAMHPEVQRKAQAELDAAIGPCRLPTLKDIEQLPYIQAIRKETSRWHSVLPLALPHTAMEDEIYNGYLIPAKTILLPNSWAIMHDPAVFEDPMSFKPERYLTADGKRLDPTVLDPEVAAFGYGRRICPGRHMSNDALSLLLASVIACYDVKPAKDAEGSAIPLNYRIDSGSLIVAPEAFECDIVPRSEQHAAMIQSLSDAL